MGSGDFQECRNHPRVRTRGGVGAEEAFQVKAQYFRVCTCMQKYMQMHIHVNTYAHTYISCLSAVLVEGEDLRSRFEGFMISEPRAPQKPQIPNEPSYARVPGLSRSS